MLPRLVHIGALWRVLPPGVHDAALKEVGVRFAHNSVRSRLLEGFSRAYLSLTGAGCSSVYLDGSYVTDKPLPRDFDACWDPTGVDPSMLDPVLLDFADGTMPFVVFFSVDRETGRPKGLVRLISPGWREGGKV